MLSLFVFSEGARDEVVQFFQRQEETNCEARDNQGWLLLKALLLLTADSSVSDYYVFEWSESSKFIGNRFFVFFVFWFWLESLTPNYTYLDEVLGWHWMLCHIHRTDYHTSSHCIELPQTGTTWIIIISVINTLKIKNLICSWIYLSLDYHHKTLNAFFPSFFFKSNCEHWCLFVCVLVGNIVLYKPRAPCCSGEMSLPASVPSS